jgi:hypothetical protein
VRQKTMQRLSQQTRASQDSHTHIMFKVSCVLSAGGEGAKLAKRVDFVNIVRGFLIPFVTMCPFRTRLVLQKKHGFASVNISTLRTNAFGLPKIPICMMYCLTPRRSVFGVPYCVGELLEPCFF